MKFMTLALTVFAISSMAAHSKVFRFDGQMTVAQKDGDYSKKFDTTLFLDPKKNQCTIVVGLDFIHCHISNYYRSALQMEITLQPGTLARFIEDAGFESVTKHLKTNPVKLTVHRWQYVNQASHLELITKWQDTLLINFELEGDGNIKPWENDPIH